MYNNRGLNFNNIIGVEDGKPKYKTSGYVKKGRKNYCRNIYIDFNIISLCNASFFILHFFTWFILNKIIDLLFLLPYVVVFFVYILFTMVTSSIIIIIGYFISAKKLKKKLDLYC